MDEAADEGTFLHAVMEEMTQKVPPMEWHAWIENTSGIGPQQVFLVKEAADQVIDLFQAGLPVYGKKDFGCGPEDHYMLTPSISDGVYLEVSVDPLCTKPGTADVISIEGRTAVLSDYKFTRVEREHDAQVLSYVLGIFETLLQIEFVETRIVAPRLAGAHTPETYTRTKDYQWIKDRLTKINECAADPFFPGCPGEPCSFCAGNGRCVWQMRSLKDVPCEATGTDLLLRDIWKPVLNPVSPEARGVRRQLKSFLKKWDEAVAEDDKQWAIDNPDTELPGFTKTVGLGRLSLESDRGMDIVEAFYNAYNIKPVDQLEFMKIDKKQAAAYLALHHGMSVTDASSEINRVLAPFMSRGAPIISFRQKKDKAVVSLAAH